MINAYAASNAERRLASRARGSEGERVAILNGFGRTLGDSIIGLQALMLAIDAGAVPRNPMLYRLPNLSGVIQQLYSVAGDLASVDELPWTSAGRGELPGPVVGFDKVVDLRDFAFDPGFRCVAMIDYFLDKLGVDPTAVPAGRKRNSWLASRIRPLPVQREADYILVCPTASVRMRCMPDPIHDWIVRWLEKSQHRRVVTQATLPRESSLSDLCRLVDSARLVISTDTAMVHLADAFSTPCLAFFTTHRPEWRMRDYPACQAVFLPTGLPDALEFARDASDVARAEAAWRPHGTDLGWLEQSLASMLTMLDAADRAPEGHSAVGATVS